ncbi:MAG: hypothetical protein ACT4TC_22685 [Myxococcaceae bacterium]
MPPCMRCLDASPESYAIEIAGNVWTQVGTLPAAIFGAMRRALERLADELGRQTGSSESHTRTGMLADGEYVASYTVNPTTRRLTLTGIGRRLSVSA